MTNKKLTGEGELTNLDFILWISKEFFCQKFKCENIGNVYYFKCRVIFLSLMKVPRVPSMGPMSTERREATPPPPGAFHLPCYLIRKMQTVSFSWTTSFSPSNSNFCFIDYPCSPLLLGFIKWTSGIFLDCFIIPEIKFY